MPPVVEKPSLTKPFTFHGIDLSGRSGDEQVTGRCPFCERENKFYVNEKTGQWNCVVCAEKGNIKTFLRRLYEESRKVKCDYAELAKERKLLHPSTLEEWGLCRSLITNEWMLPGYVIDPVSNKPKVSQLYLWRQDLKEKRSRFICQGWTNADDDVKTAHALYIGKWDDKKSKIHLLEGLWDAAAYSEVLPRTKLEGEYEYIGSPSASLFADTNIVATPGANTFYESWADIFSGKEVTILYDNDHEHENKRTKQMVQGAGILGVKRVTEILSKNGNIPTSVHYLNWGEKGFDPDFPTRYDVRDHLSKGKTDKERVKLLGELLAKVTPINPEWVGASGKKKGSVATLPIKCTTWKELREQWTKAMFWNEGLDHALTAMLACAASVNLPDDLVWLKVMSPASTGKTELAEALALAEEAIVIVSTFTGLHSGMRLEDGEDGSLISVLGGKCLIIKEGDMLLKIPEVWAELRDAYDKNTRTHFKNGVSNKYLDNPFTHILCGTSSLHQMDDSELGQRYLDIVIMEKINATVERSIGRHKISSIFDALDDDGGKEKKDGSPSEKMRARQLTAGYLEYLIPNFRKLIAGVKKDRKLIEVLNDYAQFISYFRARPSESQTEEASRELSARLGSQISKLACCLAAVLNKESLDADVMNRIRKVALDTGRGTTFNIGKMLYESGDEGMTSDIIASNLLHSVPETRTMLQFLSKIDVVKLYRKEGKIGTGTAARWKLTPDVHELYKRVIVENKECHL